VGHAQRREKQGSCADGSANVSDVRDGTASWPGKGLMDADLFSPEMTMGSKIRLRFHAMQLPIVEVDTILGCNSGCIDCVFPTKSPDIASPVLQQRLSARSASECKLLSPANSHPPTGM
jgi:hypothetical protein